MNKRPYLEKVTRDKWTKRVVDTDTPWSMYDIKHLCRIAASRPFEPIVNAWVEGALNIGPYNIDPEYTAGRERWLRARHVRIDGTARSGSPFSDHLTALFNKALDSPLWKLLGFYDCGTVLREEFQPVLFLGHSETKEGVAFVIDGGLNLIIAWRDSLESGRANWKG